MGLDAKEIFFRNKELYESAVRKYVCEECEDFNEDGSCSTHDSRGCAAYRFLPELVELALTLHERKVQPYIDAIRNKLCSHCENSGAGGQFCQLREQLDCGLDRYLPLVLDAVEEVNKKLGLNQ